MTLAPLVAITPGDGRDLKPWLAALGAAGLGTVVLREPSMAAEDYAALAEDAMRHVPQVILHARNPAAPGLAFAWGLGLHHSSGGRGGAPFGVSCHAGADLDAAFADGAAWAFLSPVWAPTSKADTRLPLGPEAFLALAAGRPVWALGGVTPRRFAALRSEGAAGAAVLGDLFGASDAEEAAERLRAYL